jgi:misacylated tRNA(Ala) deacylase
MEIKKLYLEDSYIKEFSAKVLSIEEGRFIVLDTTAFYPLGGGQPNDTGFLKRNDEEFNVISTTKKNDLVIHEVDKEGLNLGDEVEGLIDWSRRYNHMKSHTAAHVLSTVINRETGALITGNQLYENKFRVDFDLENFDKELFLKLIDIANNELESHRVVKTYYLPRLEALKIPGMVKLAGTLPPEVENLRIVEIEGLDIQADGGTHVKNTSEIGKLKFDGAENKGKGRKRVTIVLE